MLDRHLTRYGTLLIKGGKVYMDGWEANDGIMCREMSALVCLYASQFLMERARALIEKPVETDTEDKPHPKAGCEHSWDRVRAASTAGWAWYKCSICGGWDMMPDRGEAKHD